MQCRHLSLRAFQALVVMFVKGLRHVPYEPVLYGLHLVFLAPRKIGCDPYMLVQNSTRPSRFSMLHYLCCPHPQRGFAVILSRFTSSCVKRGIAKILSAFEYSSAGKTDSVDCERTMAVPVPGSSFRHLPYSSTHSTLPFRSHMSSLFYP